MKTLLLMRHAKSSWGYKVKDDWDRPLAKRGEKNAPEMGKLLMEKELVPQVVLSSAAVRAKQTSELLIKAVDFRGDIHYLSSLYMGEVDVYPKEIRHLPDEANCALIIGHNPGLETLLQTLTGKIEALPTASIAYLTVPIDTWKDFDLDCASELVHLWKPKD